MQPHVPSRSLLIQTEADVHILKGEGLIGKFLPKMGREGANGRKLGGRRNLGDNFEIK